MNVELVIAGSLCLVLAGGHTFVGRLVLDHLPRTVHPTRFGDGALTRGAVVFTWYALSLMLTTTGAILIALAQGEPADDPGEVVFLVGAAYAAATALLAWRTRRRPSDLLRAPVWVLMIVISVLCWLNT
jgi:hypothetical protein